LLVVSLINENKEKEGMRNMKEYEFTPEQSADKLMEFIRDMGDDEDQIEEEKEYVAELFDELQKSEKFEVLAHYFDLMFMDSAFK
jgi:hypothetical protein